MHKALNLGDDFDRLYVSRKVGRKGLISIENNVDASIERLEDYLEKRGGWLIAASWNNTNDKGTGRTTINRKQKWEKTAVWIF